MPKDIGPKPNLLVWKPINSKQDGMASKPKTQHQDSVMRSACPQPFLTQLSMSLPTLSQLEIGSTASVSPSAGVPTLSLHQASSSKYNQPTAGPIMKEVSPSHTSPQVLH